MASRPSAALTLAKPEPRSSNRPTGIDRFLKASAGAARGLSLDRQIDYVLEAARAATGVDRVHAWALAPGGDRLIHVGSSGLNDADRLSLGPRTEIPLADAGALGTAVRRKAGVVVAPGRPLSAKTRLKPPYSAIKALRAKYFVVAPIVADGRVLGLVCADNKYSRASLEDARLALFPVFALHLASAVEQARLAAELMPWTSTCRWPRSRHEPRWSPG